METQTNNSLFTDIELDEAANVNGGMGIVATAFAQSIINRYGSTYIPGSGYVNSYTPSYDYYDPWRYLW